MSQGKARKGDSGADFFYEVLGGLATVMGVAGLVGLGWGPFLFLIGVPIALLLLKVVSYLLEVPKSAA